MIGTTIVQVAQVPLISFVQIQHVQKAYLLNVLTLSDVFTLLLRNGPSCCNLPFLFDVTIITTALVGFTNITLTVNPIWMIW